jgi:hypothetical protein
VKTSRPTAEANSPDLSFLFQLTENAHGVEDTLIPFSPNLALIFWRQAVLFRNLGIREGEDVIFGRRVKGRVELDVVQIC